MTPPWPQQVKCPTFGWLPSLQAIRVACAESVEAERRRRLAVARLTRSDVMSASCVWEDPVDVPAGHPEDDFGWTADTPGIGA
jgi:hypothetical protein